MLSSLYCVHVFCQPAVILCTGKANLADKIQWHCMCCWTSLTQAWTNNFSGKQRMKGNLLFINWHNWVCHDGKVVLITTVYFPHFICRHYFTRRDIRVKGNRACKAWEELDMEKGFLQMHNLVIPKMLICRKTFSISRPSRALHDPFNCQLNNETSTRFHLCPVWQGFPDFVPPPGRQSQMFVAE